MSRNRWYQLATALILLGVVLMCQPFTKLLYSAGFPVILLGVILFIVLDHRAPPRPDHDRTS